MQQLRILMVLSGTLLTACTGSEAPSGSSIPPAVEWSKIGESEAYDYYADRNSIRKADETVTMSDLFDYKAVQTEGGVSVQSKITAREYDCQNRKSQALKTTWYAGRMGADGVVRSSGATGQLATVAPGTSTESLMKIACGQ